MKVYGVEISDEQQAAAVAAMSGQFRQHDIIVALVRSGVPSDDWVAHRAADRLLQRERKAGRIHAVNNKLWEQST